MVHAGQAGCTNCFECPELPSVPFPLIIIPQSRPRPGELSRAIKKITLSLDKYSRLIRIIACYNVAQEHRRGGQEQSFAKGSGVLLRREVGYLSVREFAGERQDPCDFRARRANSVALSTVSGPGVRRWRPGRNPGHFRSNF